MNFTELARKLKMTPNELREVLPQMGFDIGRRAIKVDKRIAEKIIARWGTFQKEYEREKKRKLDEETIKIKAERSQKNITVPGVITVRELAERLEIPVSTLIAELMKNGFILAMNEKIDYETSSIVASDLGFNITEEAVDAGGAQEEEQVKKIESIIQESLTQKEGLVPRPPVIVVMGHVDHGKTRLLDAIRHTNVIEGESGGITQHIGAYQMTRKDKLFTFIDTPGHEAFTTMRSRGAKIADIAILVVAADDGVKPQTLEAMKIIKGSDLPLVVAINKIDKPDANVEKVKKELSEHSLLAEDWGGETIMVPISAKEGQGIDDLLETLKLVAEMEAENLRSNPNTEAVGTIIESHVDKGEGPVASVLIQVGTLRVNDFLGIEGSLYGKVRAMRDYKGGELKEAGPGTPVKILGFKTPPTVGDIVESNASVKAFGKALKSHQAAKAQVATAITEGGAPAHEDDKEGTQSYNIILKTDVLGSLEAIVLSLEKFSHPEVRIRVVGKGLGAITESDVLKAEATSAIICGFHVKPTVAAADLAKEKEVEVREYKVIYDLIEEIKKEIEERLSPEVTVMELGRLKILAIFRKDKGSMVVGGKVTKGKIEDGSKIRILRTDEEMGQGQITELQAAKEKVTEVQEGSECGMSITTDFEIAEGDFLEAYKEEKKKKTL